LEEWNLGIKNLFKTHLPSAKPTAAELSCELL